MIALLLACTPEPEPDRARASSPAPAPEPKTTDRVAGTPCDLRTPGYICRWMGQEGIALFADLEGEHRLNAFLNQPVDVEFGPDGTPYVLDWNNHRIRAVDPDHTVRTIVGDGVIGDGIFDPASGTWSGGPALDYRLDHPTGLAFPATDPTGMYIAAWHNSRLLRYDFTSLEVAYYAGTGLKDFSGDSGPAAEAGFDQPSSVAFDDAGNLYVTDQVNQIIRRIDTDDFVTTVAGVPEQRGYNGDGPAPSVWLNASTHSYPIPSNRGTWWNGALYFADTENNLIRRFDAGTDQIVTVAGVYVPDPMLADTNGDNIGDQEVGLGAHAGDGGPAIEARLDRPYDLAFGPDGALYVADTDNHCVRVITPDGLIETFAGTCGVEWFAVPPVEASLAHDVAATEAELSHPFGVAVDAAGNVYIADTYNQVIRVVWAQPSGESP